MTHVRPQMVLSLPLAVLGLCLAATAPAQPFGDVNGDGQTDARDVQLVINASLGLEPGCGCDLDGLDGANAVDIQIVINAVLGVQSALEAPIYTYEVINTYPHDSSAFTQGLVFHGGELYESTGLRGQSSLRRVDLETGAVLQSRTLAADYFGEGLTLFDGRLFQLTWRSHTGFVYDDTSFQPLGQFTYPGEGWGLTHDGTHLIMSDGTAALRFLVPQTFTEVRRVTVHDATGPVVRLNELEYIDGQIFANVWLTDTIVRIEPETGSVTARIDLTGLLPPEDRQQPVDVLNGIAYDETTGRLFVTGKLWPKLFEIRLQRADL